MARKLTDRERLDIVLDELIRRNAELEWVRSRLTQYLLGLALSRHKTVKIGDLERFLRTLIPTTAGGVE